MSKQQLLVVISGLPVGGAEKMLVNLVNRFDRELFNTTIVSLSHYNPLAHEIDPEAAEVVQIIRRWRYDVSSPAKRIAQIIEDRSVDAVLCFGLYDYVFVRKALRMISRQPKVFISLHTTKATNLKFFVQTMIYARLLGTDEQLITVCNAQADHLSKTYFIPRKRFVTIYVGIDTEYFHIHNAAGSDVRKHYGISHDAFVVVQVARLSPMKRHEDALLAMKYLMCTHPNAKIFLFWVGGGTPKRETHLRQMAMNLGVSERVIFCGIQADVRPFLRASDLFTLTSTSGESFSQALLEAMSMGLPCVITDVGGAGEMVEEGFNGYIVPAGEPEQLADAWWRVLSHLNAFDPMAIRKRVVERFSIAQCVRQYEELLFK